MGYAKVVIGLMLGLAGFSATGCQSAVADERDKLWKQNKELQLALDQERAKKASPVLASTSGIDPAELARLQNELKQRDDELAKLRAGGGAVAPVVADQPKAGGLEGLDTTYDAKAGTVTVNLSSDVLFDSGKATLKESARVTLDKIVGALNKEYAGKPLRVEGHTDSDPITRTKDMWVDNLDLSMERAAQVSRFLAAAGIDAHRITTSGYGEYKPRDKGNKAANRRVEIVVVTR